MLSSTSDSPKKIKTKIKFVKVAAGFYSSSAISAEGDLYTWGFSGEYMGEMLYLLGNNSANKETIPQKIQGKLKGETVVDISQGEVHNLALTKSGKLFSFGHNYFGQCGSIEQVYKEPFLVPLKNRVLQVACGGFFSVFLQGDEMLNEAGASQKEKKDKKWVFF
eukprot:Phypoly_transcript_19733.p1 GENE.Phypoly_transcript_19733~~Phypoly_transcript_19733.p1  ORF type:complete len:164 (+),score=33.82 Phypoly_transcript_19733:204-695(+)